MCSYFFSTLDLTALIDQNGAQPLLDLLQHLGGWPVIDGDSWDEESWDVVEVLAKNRMEIDYNFLFSHNVKLDISNSGRYTITVSIAFAPSIGTFEEAAIGKLVAKSRS